MTRPVLLYACPTVPAEPWIVEFRRAMPEVEIRVWPDIGEPAEITHAFVWHPPRGLFARLPALRMVFSLGAGVERLLDHAELPPEIPLIRMVDPSLGRDMTIFVVMQALRYHRRMPEIERNQRARIWSEVDAPMASDRRIGILGYGELGRLCADSLKGFGFDLSVWSRSPRDAPGLRAFAGVAELPAFLARSEILVCLLPLTPETAGILNAETFAQLPQGACLINVGRGGHLVEADFLAALASGRIAEATLDVFAEEPLPADHPFWSHERITVTPHIAALTQPRTAVSMIAVNIGRDAAGLPPLYQVDRSRGY
ncbi:MAG TPA: glyoxylate/hydroxypyruvate reductase A [Acidisoma sp.]|uniref:2-hydroxyacid dehydrogenase n=1 Tax=Acidisoma sp. TaxID=1872115 RepID=UPI002B8FFC18|nr:glyoxylate/hydroxypyruvate reductase A [Acidisoma sp.]HTI00982.1 glyoxylate/hydroxypyruvate reductase A [Acidisoma sp.]